MVPPVAGERDALLAYLDEQRRGLRTVAFGLTETQIRLAPTVSSLSIGGLLKHVTAMERSWMDTVLQRRSHDSAAGQAQYGDDFVVRPGDTVESILADFDLAGDETTAIMADIGDLGRPVPVPRGVPWFPADVEAWSVRWVLLHLIEEIARHAGHADIVREAIDGATMYELVAAVEGWPATDWLTPWAPPT